MANGHFTPGPFPGVLEDVRRPARVGVDRTSSWILGERAGVVRLASRPPRFRQEGFAEAYDSTTVAYDCFLSADGLQAMLPGPPLLNLKPWLAAMQVTAQPSGTQCDFRLRTMDRHAQMRVDIPPETAWLTIESALGSVRLPVLPNQSDVFAGRRVLLTLNKDNGLEWILDWARFHRDVHGANAVLLYDNGSSRYTAEQLAAAIAGLGGIEAIRVVEWPFRYGPQSYRGRYWDSDYCQSGMLEDARWRYLQAARSVLNCDIDELVVAEKPGQASIFELAEASRRQYLRFYGKWIVTLNDAGGPGSGLRRHRDFHHATQVATEWQRYRFVSRNRCASKWAVVPASSPAQAQWKTHAITRMFQLPEALDQVAYRHFRGINTSWKYPRAEAEALDPARHRLDEALVGDFQRVDWES